MCVFVALGYDAMGYEMSKPHLRAELEADLKKLVCILVYISRLRLSSQNSVSLIVFGEVLNGGFGEHMHCIVTRAVV
jgi:hypothetical protein